MGQEGRAGTDRKRAGRRAAAATAALMAFSTVVAVNLLALPGVASAAPGGLDPSFGSGGTSLYGGGNATGATGEALVPAGDPGAGNIVVSGDQSSNGFQVTEFNSSGGVNWQSTNFAAANNGGEAFGVAVIPPGEPNAGDIVAAGYTAPTGCALVEELTSSGSFNSGFGAGGAAQLCFSNPTNLPARFSSVAVDAAGNIVVAGQVATAANPPEMLMARFTPGGAPDISFNAAGTPGYLATILPGTSVSAANGVAVAPAGSSDAGLIVVSGYSQPVGQSFYAFTVVALGSGGTLSGTFGSGGVQFIPNASTAGVGNAVMILPNGNPVVAGAVGPNGSTSLQLSQLTPNGGTVWSDTNNPTSGASDELQAVAYQPNGNFIVAAGTATPSGTPPTRRVIVAQYTPATGAVTPSFGSGGIVQQTYTNSVGAGASGIVAQPDGKTVVAATLPSVNSVSQIGLLRLLGPTVSIGAPPPVIVYFDGPITVFFPVFIDEPLGIPTFIGVCAAGGTVGGGSCTTATIPAGQTSTTVPVTANVTNTAGNTQTVALTAFTGTGFVASTTSATKPVTIQHLPPPPGFSGYWFVASDGGVFAFGPVHFYGSTGGVRLAKPIVAMAATPDGRGYWLVASDGGIFAFGDAHFYGSTGSVHLAKPIVTMVSTPDGRGYWLVASDGGIFAFGDAHFYGSTGGVRLAQPIVSMATTPDGHGYWLVASDGGVFAFGDAHFHGSTGGVRLAQPIVGMAATTTGHGYWMVARDGGIFAFGDAHFHGSTGGVRLAKPIVGMNATYGGGGYYLVASDGGIFAFGNAKFYGSTGGVKLAKPIVGMAG
jgi:Domain of unknown function (DUF5122) beta-propeller